MLFLITFFSLSLTHSADVLAVFMKSWAETIFNDDDDEDEDHVAADLSTPNWGSSVPGQTGHPRWE